VARGRQRSAPHGLREPSARGARKNVSAIAASDPELGSIAIGDHMLSVAECVRLADREFWRGKGGAFARDLVRDFGQ